MPKKLQVFISSTYEDMKEERQAAVEAILLAKHIPAGMELFAANDEAQWEVIKKWIDESDAFMLILGGRYGSIEEKSGKSYTHLEYEYAVKKKKPLFALILDAKALEERVKDRGSKVKEELNGALLAKFATLVRSKTCDFFKTTDGLKLAVMKALREIEEREDVLGWVRGDASFDASKTLDQMTRLQEENSRLREENQTLSASIAELRSQLIGDTTPETTLSKEAKRILLAITSDSVVNDYLLIPGDRLILGGKDVIHFNSAREHATWKHAIDSLDDTNLITVNVDRRGEITGEPTKHGYDAADRLRSVLDGTPPSGTDGDTQSPSTEGD